MGAIARDFDIDRQAAARAARAALAAWDGPTTGNGALRKRL
jgi:hypothetical protein